MDPAPPGAGHWQVGLVQEQLCCPTPLLGRDGERVTLPFS